nr:hypothetical protein [Candidatus Mycoplasma haematolamae]
MSFLVASLKWDRLTLEGNLPSSGKSDIFEKATHLRLFDRLTYLPILNGSVGPKGQLSLNRDYVVGKLKVEVKKRIFEKKNEFYPESKLLEKDVEGHIFYRWVKEKILLVFIIFRLGTHKHLGWFHDQFSISW